MDNRAHKKTTLLLMALCLLVTSAYAACMVCDSSPFANDFSADGSCVQKAFENNAQADDCCKKNSCTDPQPDTKTLTRRNTVTKAPVLAVINMAPHTLASQNSYASPTKADYLPPLPQDRTYLQHCSFLC